jgi:hypothetical protein
LSGLLFTENEDLESHASKKPKRGFPKISVYQFLTILKMKCSILFNIDHDSFHYYKPFPLKKTTFPAIHGSFYPARSSHVSFHVLRSDRATDGQGHDRLEVLMEEIMGKSHGEIHGNFMWESSRIKHDFDSI